MNYEHQLYANMDRVLAEIAGVADSYRQMARDTAVYLGQHRERRSNPRRPNRQLTYSEKKLLRTDDMNDVTVDPDFGTETQNLSNDLTRSPAQDLSLGRYENALLESLGRLRISLKNHTDAYLRGEASLDLVGVRKTLGRIRLAQRQLNATGHWSFLLA